MIPPEVIEQVREAADLVQLIGESVELKRTGSDWRGPCPFHGGTNRNFAVVPRKQMYHCFVCHESGDIFTYFMKKFGHDYPTAVREVAGRVGVVVPEDTRNAGPDPNEPLYSALGVAAEWFARRLREADDAGAARGYLESRDLPPALWDEFGLGYAPLPRDAFLSSMAALGIADDVLIDAGLAVRRDDGSIAPRFRGRLLFPIADVRGRVVGFGGRLLGDGEPKYLNSPESAVFHKGTLLYLLHRARSAIRMDEHAVVVEGYVDAIRLHAAGLSSAVAPLGTALTAEQCKVLRRYTRQVFLSYDADGPGLRSTFRAGDELLRQGAAVSVITLPEGEDPDTLVRAKGVAAYRALMDESVDLFERKIQILDRHGLFGSLEGRREALDKLLPTIRAAADAVTRDLYLARAAEKTGVSRAVIDHEARAGARSAVSPVRLEPTDRPFVRSAPPPEIPEERTVVRVMLMDPSWVRRARTEVTPDLFRHPYYKAIVTALLDGADAPPPDLADLWEALALPPEGPFDAEAAYSAAVAWMKDRPRQERLAEIDRLAAVAAPEEQDGLLAEKRTLIAGGDLRYRRKAFKSEREPM